MNATGAGLREVDRLDVLVLVDNATDSLSTTPKHVIPEWAGLRQAGRLSELSGAAICCAHHGLSLLIRAHVGDETHTVLFDTGPEGATLRRNAAIVLGNSGDRSARPDLLRAADDTDPAVAEAAAWALEKLQP